MSRRESNTVAIVVNNLSFLVSHRFEVCVELLAEGKDVVVIAPGPENEALKQLGCKFCEIGLDRGGLNPIKDIIYIYNLFKLLKRIKPEILHLITIKPYLYGSIIARILRLENVVISVAGMGIIFSSQDIKSKLLKLVLRPFMIFGFKRSKIIFQNEFDRQTIKWFAKLNDKNIFMIKGSGVNLAKFSVVKNTNENLVITFASRLLKSKGIEEFVEAARRIKAKNIKCVFWIVGEADKSNSDSVSHDQLGRWVTEGNIIYKGYQSNMVSILQKSDVVVLPSYYGEGLPKVLIEAAACGKPVITTDHPGCRDAIRPQETGLLVSVKSVEDLVESIELLCRDNGLRQKMGYNARIMAEKEFDVKEVVKHHLAIYGLF